MPEEPLLSRPILLCDPLTINYDTIAEYDIRIRNAPHLNVFPLVRHSICQNEKFILC